MNFGCVDMGTLCACLVPAEIRRGHLIPGSSVIGSCEVPMDMENGAQDLCVSSKGVLRADLALQH